MLCCTFYIEGQDPQRCYFGPLALAFQLFDCVLAALDFDLAAALLEILLELVRLALYFESHHASQPLVDHEPQSVGNIAFEYFG